MKYLNIGKGQVGQELGYFGSMLWQLTRITNFSFYLTILGKLRFSELGKRVTLEAEISIFYIK